MVDFASLKSRSGKSGLEQLTNELAKLDTSTKKDDRFWYPNVDKAGNGYAVIRFLPAPGDEQTPFVRVFSHGFKGPSGQWYIENSLTTIGKPDPVGELNSQLWNISEDDNSPTRKQARNQKRKLGYISNVYVISDSMNPENDGKVFLFRYGKKIFDKLNEAMNPQFADETPMNPFDLWTGANFKVKIRNVEGYRNYDKSEFAEAGPLDKSDKKLEAIWTQCYSLQAFLSPEQFKSYDVLKARLDVVLGTDQRGKLNTARTKAAEKAADPAGEEMPWSEPKSSPAAAPSEPAESDDEDMAYFERLARGVKE